MDTTAYAEGEELWCAVVLTNQADTVQYTAPLGFSWEAYNDFSITDSLGNPVQKYHFEGSHSYRKAWPGIAVLPHHQLYQVWNLYNNFGQIDSLHGFFRYLPPGQYTLRFTHYTDYHWTQQLTPALAQQYGPLKARQRLREHSAVPANSLAFQIYVPQRKVQENANWIFRASRMIAASPKHHFPESVREVIEHLQIIAKQGPPSPYSTTAHYYLQFFSVAGDPLGIEWTPNLLFYAQSLYSCRALNGTQDSTLQRLSQQVQREAPHSVLSTFIQIELEQRRPQ